ncbi:MAG: hypothetical protein QOG79_4051 [Mycobacterium sp.]|jgi:hypothetical protein|nr:hypothetical protein [Mycobacterium sp.]MDT5364795.1 hypothetical protein [Mycobacterium sp.]
MKRSIAGVIAALACAAGAGVVTAAPAQADDIGYLINVTLRPGYNFANAQAALDYGNGLCDRIGQKQSYADLASSIRSDFNTSDEFQISYLLSQATQELCPAQIWQLRQSAAGYRVPA